MSKTLLGFGKTAHRLSALHHDELLTADIEDDDYDALNDETFGGSLGGEDWEEAHAKFAELEDKGHLQLGLSELLGNESDPTTHHGSSGLSADLQDIVKRSISYLGLEDDHEEDPAIMTYSKMPPSPWPTEWRHPVTSPPPPAILEQQFGGSPSAETIWSPRAVDSPDDKLGILLKALQQQSLAKSTTEASPLPANVKTVEELERDILSSSGKTTPSSHPTLYSWNADTLVNRADHLERDVLERLQSRRMTDVEHDLLKKGCVSPRRCTPRAVPIPERQDRRRWPSVGSPPDGMVGFAMGMSPPFTMTSPGFQPCMSPPVPPGLSGMCHSRGALHCMPPGYGTRMPPPLPRSLPSHTMMGHGRMMSTPQFGPSMLNSMPRRSNMPMPRLPPCLRPGMNQVRMPPNHHQPYYHRQQQQHYQQYHTLEPHWRADFERADFERADFERADFERADFERADFERAPALGPDDVYAGLMTQREKDWLIRIQLLQLQTDNPEIDDYYFTMFTKKAVERKEETIGMNGDGDKLRFLRPERVRTESKSYTPMQFERSLGKLQVVSVNYPRKILDMGVQRLSEEEDRKVPPDKDLLWFRQLLLDIEKLYCTLLDYERPSCPEEDKPRVSEKLFNDLYESDDRLMQIVGVRKGRALVLRALPILKHEHRVVLVSSLLRQMASVQRKDRHDHLLLQGYRAVVQCIQKCSLEDLVQLAESLLANPAPALATVFALRTACAVLERAEGLLETEVESSQDIRERWSSLALDLARCLADGLTPGMTADVGTVAFSQDSSAILAHLYRLHADKAIVDKLLSSPLCCRETVQRNGCSDQPAG